MIRIGLTGGIGSGKSTVCERFRALGATCIDADAISRTLTAPGGAALTEIVAAFGPGVLAADGGLDRPAMRARAFGNPDVRRRLEAILHPRVRDEIEAATRASRSEVVILDIPLLIESGGWRARVDRVLVVDLPVALQIRRVCASRGLRRVDVEPIVASQATREQRLAAADDILFNGGSVEDLKCRVDRLYAGYRAAAPDRDGR